MSTFSSINIEMFEVRKHYVYAWVDTTNDLPFYIGVGSHLEGIKTQTKYARAYHIHYANGTKKRLAFCQRLANKLMSNGTPHIVKILYDNLTLGERMKYEHDLIKEYGRRSERDGILCNITEGGEANPMHIPAVREKHAKIMKTIINIPTITPESKENHRMKTLANMRDPIYRAKWNATVRSEENIEKLRSTQPKSKAISFNGVEYRSVSELSRCLDISKSLLLYRIKNNIPYDAPVDKGNKFSRNKRPAKNKLTRKCVECLSIKEINKFSSYLRGTKVHHSKLCVECSSKNG